MDIFNRCLHLSFVKIHDTSLLRGLANRFDIHYFQYILDLSRFNKTKIN